MAKYDTVYLSLVVRIEKLTLDKKSYAKYDKLDIKLNMPSAINAPQYKCARVINTQLSGVRGLTTHVVTVLEPLPVPRGGYCRRQSRLIVSADTAPVSPAAVSPHHTNRSNTEPY